ncbi:hypothetical protein PR202_gb18323 [Eleusine coracana subsp. coracana]|uniref:Uncharacterized protein n=1 Tax=Eleusine coracana subsp. coracana TaxID=191504 RepID=A0AAV5F5A1_ELECO|nr:hypothetical protein PR202_gb18323 [Eleusine coracana subsp. coracana]
MDCLTSVYRRWKWRNIDYNSPIDPHVCDQLVREHLPSFSELKALDMLLATECLKYYSDRHPMEELMKDTVTWVFLFCFPAPHKSLIPSFPARKIELQGSLVEVLESERLVLLGENARLGFRALAAEEELVVAAAELGYMRRRAAEMAQLVVKLREDHRVCMMGRKVEALQAQVYGLELRNHE